MPEKAFLDADAAPTAQTLRAALGKTYPHLVAITDVAHAYAQTWMFTKSGGWMLKVSDRKKALFCAIPLKGALRVSLALRDNEKVALSKHDGLEAIRDELALAKKAPEGYALRLVLESKRHQHVFVELLRELIRLRA